MSQQSETQQQHPIQATSSPAADDKVCDMCELRGCKLYNKSENKMWNEIDEYVAVETDIAGDSWIPDNVDDENNDSTSMILPNKDQSSPAFESCDHKNCGGSCGISIPKNEPSSIVESCDHKDCGGSCGITIPNDKSADVCDHKDCGGSCGITITEKSADVCDHKDCGGSCGVSIPEKSLDVCDHQDCGGSCGVALQNADNSNGSYPTVTPTMEYSMSQQQLQPIAPNIPMIPTAADPKDADKNMIQKSQDWMLSMIQKITNPYSMGSFFSNPPDNASMNNNQHPAVSAVDKEEGPSAASPKKRKRNQIRKKIIPTHKIYRNPTDNDVLMGRGTKSNQHPGNIKYREEILRTQGDYKKTDCKQEKTRMSADLVQRVQANGGNFLEQDDKGWYIIDDTVARGKVSQALREDKDPEKRRAKRQRFLARRQAAMRQGR